ncbi:MAG: hypothetical protein LBL61_02005 [Elusimicrobiota bacterium]|jgi:hypothetical protein|nr:hypothetical protein [Elusimicrobiota bacterium]
MKKTLTVILCGVLFVGIAFAQNASKKNETASTTSTVSFDGETYALAYSDGGENYNPKWLNEYLRKGDTLERWIKMVAIRDYGVAVSKHAPEQMALVTSQNLLASNPQAKYKTYLAEDKNEAMIDFFTWTPDGKIAEFNVFKFAIIDGSLISYQFAFREYDGKGGIVDVINNKQSFVDKVSSIKIPKIQKIIKKENGSK